MAEEFVCSIIDQRHRRVLATLLEKVQKEQADLIQTAADLAGVTDREGLALNIGRDGSVSLVRQVPDVEGGD